MTTFQCDNCDQREDIDLLGIYDLDDLDLCSSCKTKYEFNERDFRKWAQELLFLVNQYLLKNQKSPVGTFGSNYQLRRTINKIQNGYAIDSNNFCVSYCATQEILLKWKQGVFKFYVSA